ncbi:MAG: hypothetical protein JSU70_08165 [Phycisphaerales bacterium]|nr:MAG: hypothetical protein JSU70_08165 [Phycisphaerales bacterium]
MICLMRLSIPKLGLRVFITTLAAGVSQLHAADYYVSPRGSTDAVGSLARPFRTITRALEDASAGDRILLLEGCYAEPVAVGGIHGAKNAPITIGAASGARVIFDGTDELAGTWKLVTPSSPEGGLIQPAQWKRIGDHKLYAMQLEQDIHALIYDGRLMSDARWPNARWDDPWRLDRYMVLRLASEDSKPGEIHDGVPTENTLEESSKWIHYERSQLNHRDESLADTGLDFTGASVLLSSFWTSFGTRVTGHKAGQNYFTFDTEFHGSGSLQTEAIRHIVNRVEWDNPRIFARSTHGSIHYFLMGLPALDIPQEWFYRRSSRTLYFISPDGSAPVPGKARGKRHDHLLIIKDSEHVHVKGIEFSGASALLQDCRHSRIEDCSFRFSAYNKFVLGNYDMPVTTQIDNSSSNGDTKYGNALINCRFQYLDGNAFKGSSAGLTVDNVLIYQTQMTTLGSDSRSASLDSPLVVRRVTLSDIGASVGIRGGGIDSVYELNNLQRFGGLQYDGAGLQMGGTEQKIYRWNWSHDHPKFSYRFDTPKYGPEATHGEMSYNVAWNTPGGYMVKGDKHLFHNNLLLGEEASVFLFNLPEWASSNRHTLAANNAVPAFWADRRKGKAEMLATLKNNVTGDIAQHLRDPDNLDFRPKKGSSLINAGAAIKPADVPWKTTPITRPEEIGGNCPDIGAYEYGSSHYWIPGFKFRHASTPVPPDGTTTAKNDCDLMWLGGYKADTHDLYLGMSAEEVASATKDGPAFRKTFRGPANIFDPGELEHGKTYFWRVDAISVGKIIKGSTWKFTVATKTADGSTGVGGRAEAREVEFGIRSSTSHHRRRRPQ